MSNYVTSDIPITPNVFRIQAFAHEKERAFSSAFWASKDSLQSSKSPWPQGLSIVPADTNKYEGSSLRIIFALTSKQSCVSQKSLRQIRNFTKFKIFISCYRTPGAWNWFLSPGKRNASSTSTPSWKAFKGFLKAFWRGFERPFGWDRYDDPSKPLQRSVQRPLQKPFRNHLGSGFCSRRWKSWCKVSNALATFHVSEGDSTSWWLNPEISVALQSSVPKVIFQDMGSFQKSLHVVSLVILGEDFCGHFS